MKIARFEFSLFGINTYVVWDPVTKDCAVIDPGMISGEEQEVLTHFIEREGLRVTHLINTHLHVDHAIGNRFVERTYGVGAEAHPGDEELGRMLKAQATSFHLRIPVEDVEISHRLKEGEKIKIGEGELEVIHVPGHSPGGISLYDRKDGFLVSGDSLFEGSVGRTDLHGGSMSQLISNIQEKLMTLPAETDVFPGHGDATSIGAEKRHNPYLNEGMKRNPFMR